MKITSSEHVVYIMCTVEILRRLKDVTTHIKLEKYYESESSFKKYFIPLCKNFGWSCVGLARLALTFIWPYFAMPKIERGRAPRSAPSRRRRRLMCSAVGLVLACEAGCGNQRLKWPWRVKKDLVVLTTC